MLDRLEDDVDQAEGSMASLNRKMKSMMAEAQKSDRAMYGVIVCLCLLLAVLTMMVLE